MLNRRSKRVATTTAIVAGLSILAAGGGTAVWAAGAKASQEGDTIQACVGRHGALRLQLPDGCHGPEGLISWNQQGPQGIQGIQGPPGPSLNPNPAQDVLANGVVLTQTPSSTGLDIVLPADGTYLLNANVRGIINFATASANHDCRIEVELRSAPATAVPNTRRTVTIDQSNLASHTSNTQATAPINMIYTGTAGTTITLWGVAFGNNCGTGAGIASNSGGRTTLNAVRIQ